MGASNVCECCPRSEVLTTGKLSNAAFLAVTPCGAGGYNCFGGTYSVHVQDELKAKVTIDTTYTNVSLRRCILSLRGQLQIRTFMCNKQTAS